MPFVSVKFAVKFDRAYRYINAPKLDVIVATLDTLAGKRAHPFPT